MDGRIKPYFTRPLRLPPGVQCVQSSSKSFTWIKNSCCPLTSKKNDINKDNNSYLAFCFSTLIVNLKQNHKDSKKSDVLTLITCNVLDENQLASKKHQSISQGKFYEITTLSIHTYYNILNTKDHNILNANGRTSFVTYKYIPFPFSAQKAKLLCLFL